MEIILLKGGENELLAIRTLRNLSLSLSFSFSSPGIAFFLPPPPERLLISTLCTSLHTVLELQLYYVFSSADRFLEFEICFLVGPRVRNCAIGSVLDLEIHCWDGLCE
ncbi:hypothetical protein Csa_010829 [Cucumis sativus]|uniref:Uncharacterized protein n=1 Tax=Cucumis sativus TaxID=3659 RepID=A0A0A0L213_CUCSA|nr:hypothetical protein Csa_010829 [Cucumis sativus]